MKALIIIGCILVLDSVILLLYNLHKKRNHRPEYPLYLPTNESLTDYSVEQLDQWLEVHAPFRSVENPWGSEHLEPIPSIIVRDGKPSFYKLEAVRGRENRFSDYPTQVWPYDKRKNLFSVQPPLDLKEHHVENSMKYIEKQQPYTKQDTCIACGAYIPEGMLVCPSCGGEK